MLPQTANAHSLGRYAQAEKKEKKLDNEKLFTI
jgi:hypothetical protein